MQSFKTDKTKRKFGINLIYYQIPIIVVIAFFLGFVGNKLAEQFIYIYHGSSSISGFPYRDWCEGCQALLKTGVSSMTVIVEIIFFAIMIYILWLITSVGAKRAEERDRIRTDKLDKKLDELPQKIAEAIMIALGKQLICPNECDIKQKGSKFCSQCRTKLVWK